MNDKLSKDYKSSSLLSANITFSMLNLGIKLEIFYSYLMSVFEDIDFYIDRLTMLTLSSTFIKSTKP